jgi:hypothetical protein
LDIQNLLCIFAAVLLNKVWHNEEVAGSDRIAGRGGTDAYGDASQQGGSQGSGDERGQGCGEC